MIDARWIAAALAAASLGFATPGRAGGQESEASAVEQLKRYYLACDRQAVQRRLLPAEAMRCSAVAEHLLATGFDGNFERMLAWWRATREGSPRETALSAPAETGAEQPRD
jgi:hypothetical protein